MQISARGTDLIERYESFAAKPYICPAGKLTVGYGHVILAKEKGHYDSGITELEAERLLLTDVAKARSAIMRLVCVPISQAQFDALVSFTFNVGAGALQRSTLRQRLNREDYDGAAAEFGKWVYGGGRKLAGLVRRRADERALFMSEPIEEAKQVYIALPWLGKAA
ncbi:MAG: lysozyme [Alphaproteobacteria bacterium]|nr:lysozyme [Alphaproteobacteria bacterium]